MTERKPAIRLADKAAAIAAAHAVADRLRPIAQDKSREGDLPREQLDILFDSGVPAIAVPTDLGGIGASIKTIVETVRIVSHADGSIGQVLQLHNVMIAGVLNSPLPETRDYFASKILAGQRFANALAEIGGKNKLALRTTLTPQPDGSFRLNGRKFYSTGSYLADWLSVGCVSPDGVPAFALVERDAPGVTVLDDWRAFGQRTTMSGTVIFEDVHVPPHHAPQRNRGTNRAVLTRPQILHAAIDTGIARGALDAAIEYLRHHSRAWIESGADHITQEPHVIKQIGEFASTIYAAEILLRNAAEIYDRALADPADEALTTEAILAVAHARVASDHASLKVGAGLFDLLGASAVQEKFNLDRFWRNARTHTTHDPIRWRLHAIGDHALNDAAPIDFPVAPDARGRFLQPG